MSIYCESDQWAWPGAGRANVSITSDDPTDRNIAAMETVLTVFRCPSAHLPDHIFDVSTDNWAVQRRSPGSYVANCSSTILQDWVDRAAAGGYSDDETQRLMFMGDLVVEGQTADGAFRTYHQREIAEFTDGTSSTIMVGEVLADPKPGIPNVQEDWFNGRLASRGLSVQKDHWPIGGDDPDVLRDSSEVFGSTAVRINYPKAPPTDRNFGQYEISYSSAHPGGANFLLGDGSVRFIKETINPTTFRALGSIQGAETISADQY